MQVTITYNDFDSLTVDEAISNAKTSVRNGESAEVEVRSSTNQLYSEIFILIQKHYGIELSSVILDYGAENVRKAKFEALKRDFLEDSDSIFEDVIAFLEEGLLE